MLFARNCCLDSTFSSPPCGGGFAFNPLSLPVFLAPPSPPQMGKANAVKVPRPEMRFRVNDAPICRDFLSGRTGGAARAPVSCLRSGSAAGRKPAGFTPEPLSKHAGGMLGEMRPGRLFLGGSPNASVYRARPEVSRVHSLKTRIDADLEPFCEPTVNSEDKPGNCCRVNDHYTAYKPAQAAARSCRCAEDPEICS